MNPRFRNTAIVGILVSAIALVASANAVETFAVGTAASTVDLRQAAGAVPLKNGWAIPLRGARPDWYTPALQRAVFMAAGKPVAAPLDAPLPSEFGIRPGAWMIEPAGCTMNFIFANGTKKGIGTAGHCVDRLGQHVVLLTLAPASGNPVLVDIGAVIARRNAGIGNDFALVEIRPQLHSWVSPTAAVIAGPCGAYGGPGPETVFHYGHGTAIGIGGTPRAGVALTWKDSSYFWSSPTIFGDSGSPVRITDLKAAGNLTHLVVDTRFLPNFVAGTRIGKILSIASGWRLVNSPLCL
jgi:hypothetical protein